MTELDVVDEDDTVDNFDELDASAAVFSITIVCDVLSQGRFLFVTGWCKSCDILCILVYQSGVGRLLSRLPAWQEEKKDAGSSSQKCECRP